MTTHQLLREQPDLDMSSHTRTLCSCILKRHREERLFGTRLKTLSEQHSLHVCAAYLPTNDPSILRRIAVDPSYQCVLPSEVLQAIPKHLNAIDLSDHAPQPGVLTSLPIAAFPHLPTGEFRLICGTPLGTLNGKALISGFAFLSVSPKDRRSKNAFSKEFLTLCTEFSRHAKAIDDEYELAWRRSAYSALTAFEQKTRGELSKQVTERNPDGDLLNALLGTIREKLLLTRIALVTPSEHESLLWTIEYESGFPKPLIERSLYKKGQGLTGRTLELDGTVGDAAIVSLDILNDRRWSKIGGNTFLESDQQKSTTQDTLKSNKPRECFIGVPVFSSLDDGSTPFGALVAVRESRTSLPAFLKMEAEFLRSASSLLSFVIDSDRWYREAETRRHRLAELTSLMSSSRTTQDKYFAALDLLATSSAFGRLLLAHVDRESLRIRGKAAIGFEESLVALTDRILFTNLGDVPPADVLDAAVRRKSHNSDTDHNAYREPNEDILSLFARCFRRLSPKDPASPFIISSASPLWKHVNTRAAIHVGLPDRIALLPLIASSGDIIGIVLAELSPEYVELSKDDVAECKLFCNSLAGLLENDASSVQQRRVHDVLNTALSEIRPFATSNHHPDSVLAVEERILQSICRNYDFEQGVLFSHNAQHHLLDITAGYRINVADVRLDADAAPDSVTASFVGEVFRSQRIKFHWRNAEPPVNQKVRSKLGIDAESGLFGIPLLLGSRIYGVLLLVTRRFMVFHRCFRPNSRPRIAVPQGLNVIAEVLAYLLYARGEAVAKADSDVQMSAEQAALYATSRLANLLASDTASHLGNISTEIQALLSTIARYAVTLFHANACGVFLADRVITLKASPGETSDAVLGRIPSNIGLRIVAGDGYLEHAYLRSTPATTSGSAYKSGTRSLTMSVVQALRPRRTEIIQNDRLWSGQMQSLLDPSRFGSQKNRRRAWMGVPLMFRDSQYIYIFGVLSVTREHISRRERSGFSKKELATLSRVSNMLALALSVHQFRQDSISRLQAWNEHDTGRIRQAIVEDLLPRSDVFVSGKASEDWRAYVQVFVDFLASSVHVFTREEWRSEPWRMQPGITLSRIVRELRVLSHIHRETFCDVSINCTQDASIGIDLQRLLHIAVNLIKNGVEAVGRKLSHVDAHTKQFVQVDLQFHEGVLRIIVDDTGDGLSDDLFERLCSGTAGRGRGMAICRHLICGIGGEFIVDTEKPAGVATRIVATIPVRGKTI